MGIAIIDKINAEQTAGLAKKGFPEFRAGDVVRVSVRIKEGDKTRVRLTTAVAMPLETSRSPATATACAWRSSSRSTALRSRRSCW